MIRQVEKDAAEEATAEQRRLAAVAVADAIADAIAAATGVDMHDDIHMLAMVECKLEKDWWVKPPYKYCAAQDFDSLAASRDAAVSRQIVHQLITFEVADMHPYPRAIYEKMDEEKKGLFQYARRFCSQARISALRICAAHAGLDEQLEIARRLVGCFVSRTFSTSEFIGEIQRVESSGASLFVTYEPGCGIDNEFIPLEYALEHLVSDLPDLPPIPEVSSSAGSSSVATAPQSSEPSLSPDASAASPAAPPAAPRATDAPRAAAAASNDTNGGTKYTHRACDNLKRKLTELILFATNETIAAAGKKLLDALPQIEVYNHELPCVVSAQTFVNRILLLQKHGMRTGDFFFVKQNYHANECSPQGKWSVQLNGQHFELLFRGSRTLQGVNTHMYEFAEFFWTVCEDLAAKAGQTIDRDSFSISACRKESPLRFVPVVPLHELAIIGEDGIITFEGADGLRPEEYADADLPGVAQLAAALRGPRLRKRLTTTPTSAGRSAAKAHESECLHQSTAPGKLGTFQRQVADLDTFHFIPGLADKPFDSYTVLAQLGATGAMAMSYLPPEVVGSRFAA